MQREYAPLVNLALDLAALGKGDPQRAEMEASYETTLHAFATGVLKDQRIAVRAVEAVNHDLNKLVAMSEADMHPVFDRIRYDVVNRIEEEAGPTWIERIGVARLVGLGGMLLVVLLLAGYFGLRAYNAIEIRDKIDTRPGIEQRAAALEKLLKHGADPDTVDMNRSALIRRILHWPLEPTESETAAARQLAALIFEGADRLKQEGQACNLPLPSGTMVTEEEAAMLLKIATGLRDKQIAWRTPPAATVLDVIRANYPCKAAGN